MGDPTPLSTICWLAKDLLNSCRDSKSLQPPILIYYVYISRYVKHYNNAPLSRLEVVYDTTLTESKKGDRLGKHQFNQLVPRMSVDGVLGDMNTYTMTQMWFIPLMEIILVSFNKNYDINISFKKQTYCKCFHFHVFVHTWKVQIFDKKWNVMKTEIYQSFQRILRRITMLNHRSFNSKVLIHETSLWHNRKHVCDTHITHLCKLDDWHQDFSPMCMWVGVYKHSFDVGDNTK